MSGGEVAGILVAVFWAILVSFLAVVLVRLAQTLRATTKLVADVTEQAVPLLADASDTVRSARTQLDKVDAIATDVQEVTSNASALSTTVASTFGGPLVKVAAFGYGYGGPSAASPIPSRNPPAVRCSSAVPCRPPAAGSATAEIPADRRTDAAMFRRTFWFTAGAAAGVWATTKVNRKLKQLTPESLRRRPRTGRSRRGTS